MAKNKVEIVGINTSKLKTLKKDELIYLLNEYHKGNKDVFSKLVEGNYKLVLSVVRKYNNRKENLDDLFQVGVLGLIKAINNFDISKNLLFSTYAVPMISGEIKRYLRDNSLIKVSRQLKDIAYKSLKIKEDYILKYNKEPSIKEISNILKIDEFEVKEAFDSSISALSIHDPINNDANDEIYLIDQLSDNDESKLINLITLKDALLELDDEYRLILRKRYYDDLTQMEVAKEFNVSQAQISRIEKDAITKLRKYF